VRFTSTYLNGTSKVFGGWYMTRFSSNLHWRIYIRGSKILLNGAVVNLNKAACTAKIK
jgi:hypothetical protein